jgi:hypothetical protein
LISQSRGLGDVYKRQPTNLRLPTDTKKVATGENSQHFHSAQNPPTA